MDLTKKQELYTDAIVLLTHVSETTREKSEYLKTVCLTTYGDKFALVADSLERTLNSIERFNHEKKYDEDGLFGLFSQIKDYFEYYIRLCDNSTPSNYVQNAKYISESMYTVFSVVSSKLRHISDKFNKI